MKKLLLALVAFFALSFGAFAAVNLNTATKDELDTVKGIGPVKAQAIIDYRQAHGPFKSVDELKNVRGFGEKTVAKMRSELTVTGATTVRSEPAKTAPGKTEPAQPVKTQPAQPAPAQTAPTRTAPAQPEQAEVKKHGKDKAAKEDKAGKQDEAKQAGDEKKGKKDKQSKKDKKKAQKEKKDKKKGKDSKQEQK